VASLDGSLQVCVPEKLRQGVLRLEHDVVRAGHPEVNRVYAAVRWHFYLEYMAADLADYVHACDSCARNRVTPQRRFRLVRLFPSTEPFASVSLEILGPFTETKTGNRFLFIIVDRFTKLVRAVPRATTTATDVSSAFCRDWITVYGPPDTALTDKVPQVPSLLFEGVCGLMGITNLDTTTCHPQTYGQVHRFCRSHVYALHRGPPGHLG